MMRFQQSLAAGLATLLVVPAVGRLGEVDGDGIDLASRLAATARAIDGLGALAERIGAGEREAVLELIGATEPPALDGPGRDAELVRLRRDVGDLHEALDQLSSSAKVGFAATPAPTSGDERATPPEVPTHGLGPGEREALARLSAPASEPRSDRTAPRSQRATDYEKDPEYTADALRQARLYLRLGRAADAIGILTPAPQGPEGRYLLARAKERAGIYDEALAEYEALAGDPAAGTYAERAAIDAGFLRVKRELAQRAARKEQVK